MHIKFVSENSREAHLANKRLLIMKDCSCRAPDVNMDLIFHRGHGEVWGFKLRETYGYEEEVFTADRAKVDEESKACGHKTEAEKREWLEGIKKAEAYLWQAWMDGDVYGILVQEWDAHERKWNAVDATFEMFGWNDVVECLKDMNLDDIDVFCIDEDLGDPESWKAEYKEIDV